MGIDNLRNKLPATKPAANTSAKRERMFQGDEKGTGARFPLLRVRIRESGERVIFDVATYVVTIDDTRTLIGGRKGKYARTFAMNVTVEESDNDALPKGSRASYIRSLGEASRAMALGEIKMLTAAAVGCSSESEFEESIPYWPDLCEQVLEGDESVATDDDGKPLDPNPLAGARIRVIVTPSGKPDPQGVDYGRYTFEAL